MLLKNQQKNQKLKSLQIDKGIFKFFNPYMVKLFKRGTNKLIEEEEPELEKVEEQPLVASK